MDQIRAQAAEVAADFELRPVSEKICDEFAARARDLGIPATGAHHEVDEHGRNVLVLDIQLPAGEG
jgi:hypothetical protein